jgi:hypothetical protein
MSWPPTDISANRYLKTFFKDLVDLSGQMNVRHGDISIIDGSFNIDEAIIRGADGKIVVEDISVNNTLSVHTMDVGFDLTVSGNITTESNLGVGELIANTGLSIVSDQATQLLVKPISSTTNDTSIEFQGSTNGANKPSSSLTFSNHDSDKNGDNISTFGKIAGIVRSSVNNIGDLHILTSSDGNSLQKTLCLRSSGNVGVGAEYPTHKLHVAGASMYVGTGATGEIMLPHGTISSTATELTLATDALPIRFNQAAGERMRIDSGGNVGIGTDIPTTKLDVKGTTTTSVLVATGNSGFDSDLYVNGTTTTSALIATGDSSFNSDLYIDGSLNVAGKTIIEGDLDVTGATRIFGTTPTLEFMRGTTWGNDVLTDYRIASESAGQLNFEWTDGGSTSDALVLQKGDVTVPKTLTVTNDIVLGTMTINNAGTFTSTNNMTLEPQGSVSTVGTVNIKGSLTVDGSINFTGDFIRTDTNVQITEQLDISNNGTGTALIARQHGSADVAEFYDDNTLAMVIKGGGAANGSGYVGYVGIGTNAPGEKLEVNGNIYINNGLTGTTQGGKLIFDNTHSTTGPNKIQLRESYGFGVLSNTLGYFTNTYHTWYHNSSNATNGDYSMVLNGASLGIGKDPDTTYALDVFGRATISGGVTISDELSVSGKYIGSDVSINSLSVLDDSSFNADLYIGGDLSATHIQADTLTVMNTYTGNDVNINNLSVLSDSSFNSDLHIGGDLSATNIQASTNITTDTLTVTNTHIGNDVSINQLYVENDSSFNSNLNVVGNLTVTGVIFNNSDAQTFLGISTTTLTVTDLHIGEDISINETLSVQNDSSFNHNLYVGGDLTVDGITFNDSGYNASNAIYYNALNSSGLETGWTSGGSGAIQFPSGGFVRLINNRFITSPAFDLSTYAFYTDGAYLTGNGFKTNRVLVKLMGRSSNLDSAVEFANIQILKASDDSILDIIYKEHNINTFTPIICDITPYITHDIGDIKIRMKIDGGDNDDVFDFKHFSICLDDGSSWYKNSVYKQQILGGLSIGQNYIGQDLNTNNLLVEGKVGFGTTDPTAALHINSPETASSSHNSAIKILTNGKFNTTVGSSWPVVEFQNVSHHSSYGELTDSAGQPFTQTSINMINYNTTSSGQYGMEVRVKTGLGFSVRNGATLHENALTISNLGRVGIGTFVPEHALHVVGNIKASGDGYFGYARIGTNGSTAEFKNDGATYGALRQDGDNNTTIGGSNINFQISDTNEMSITSSGISVVDNVTVGSDLTVNGTNISLGAVTLNNAGTITTTTGNDIVLQPQGSDSTIGTVTIKGELVVDGSINFTGDFIRTETNVQITEQLDISNIGTGPALIARQHGENDIAAFYDDSALAMIIKGGTDNGGYVGIGTTNPLVKLAIHSSDAIKIPVGTTAERPTTSSSIGHGYIRYNTTLSSYEGFGTGNAWGSLSGVKDVDQDTYISAENNAGDNNNQLKFVTAGTERMIIGATGNIGIGTTDNGTFALDVLGNARFTGTYLHIDGTDVNEGGEIRVGSGTNYTGQWTMDAFQSRFRVRHTDFPSAIDIDYSTKSVGVGKEPAANVTLDVSGDIRIDNGQSQASTQGGRLVFDDANNMSGPNKILLHSSGYGFGVNASTLTYISTQTHKWYYGSTLGMTLDGGKLGIGVDPGNYELKVAGSANISGNLTVDGITFNGDGYSTSNHIYYNSLEYSTLQTNWTSNGTANGTISFPSSEYIRIVNATYVDSAAIDLSQYAFYTDGAFQTDAGFKSTRVLVKLMGRSKLHDAATDFVQIQIIKDDVTGTLIDTIYQENNHLSQDDFTPIICDITPYIKHGIGDIKIRINLNANNNADYFDFKQFTVCLDDGSSWYKNSVYKQQILGGLSVGQNYTGQPLNTNNLIVEGNIGVGTTDPKNGMQIVKNNGLTISPENTLVSVLRLGEPTDTNSDAYCSKITSTHTSGTGAADLRFYTSASTATSSTERMVIKSDGNVGIGITDPQTSLDILSSMRIQADSTGSAILNFMRGTGTFGSDEYSDYIIKSDSGVLSFIAGTNEIIGTDSFANVDVMQLSRYGQVAIGGPVTSSTSGPKLHVIGDANIDSDLTVGGSAAISGNIVATIITGTLFTASQPNVTTMTGLVTVGPLTSGSIASGFGNIDIGANAFTAGNITGTLSTTDQPNVATMGGLVTVGPLTSGSIAAGFGSIDIGGNVLTAGSAAIDDMTMNGVGAISTTTNNILLQPKGSDSTVGTVTIKGELVVDGSINFTGEFIRTDTNVQITEQLDISNNGSGPALIARQHGTADIAEFYDDLSLAMVIKGGGVTGGTGNVGYVGIGTDNPLAKLDVQGSIRAAHNSDTTSYFGNAAIGFTDGLTDMASFSHIDRNTTANYALVQNSDGETFLNCESGKNINFKIGNSDKMRLSSNGNFGIGTTAPTAKLHVDGNVFLGLMSSVDTVGTLTLGRSDSHGARSHSITVQNAVLNASNFMAFNVHDSATYTDAPTEQMRIRGDGRVGIGTDTPTAELDVSGSASISVDLNVAGSAAITGDIVATNITGTLSTTSQPNVTTMNGLVTVGTLASGSIASGFGSIDIGGNDLTAGSASISGDIAAANITGTLSTTSQPNVTTMTGLVTVGTLASGSISSDFGDINIGTNVLTAGSISGTLSTTDQSAITKVGVLVGGSIASGFGSIDIGGNDLTAGSISGTLSTTDQSAITKVGALASGSISSDFGDINIGTNDLTAGSISGTLLTADSAAINDMTLNGVGAISTATNNILLQPQGAASTVGTVTIKGGLVVDGSINFTGEFIRTDTNVQITEQLDISNSGTGPALIARQYGTADIAAFYDDDQLAMVIKGGYNSGTGNVGFVGIGTNTPASKLDVLGSIRASYDLDSTSYFGNAAIGYNGYHGDMATFSHIDHNNRYGYAMLHTSDGMTLLNCAIGQYISFRINNVDKMYLDSDGNFGIGTTNPQNKLHVNGDVFLGLMASHESIGTLTLGRADNTSSDNYRPHSIEVKNSSTASSNYIAFKVHSGGTSASIAPTERMTIKGDGNVGIGSTAPAAKLDVNGSTNATSFNATSDMRHKENICDLHESLNKICSIRGVNYTFKNDDKNKLHAGILAQEVAEIIPEAIDKSCDDKWTANYNTLVGYLIESVKTLKSENDALKIDHMKQIEAMTADALKKDEKIESMTTDILAIKSLLNM